METKSFFYNWKVIPWIASSQSSDQKTILGGLQNIACKISRYLCSWQFPIHYRRRSFNQLHYNIFYLTIFSKINIYFRCQGSSKIEIFKSPEKRETDLLNRNIKVLKSCNLALDFSRRKRKQDETDHGHFDY